jgi:hypothetical protein
MSAALYSTGLRGRRAKIKPAFARRAKAGTEDGLDRRQEPALRFFGGARGSRTPDLLNAIQALSQLSYGPDRDQWSVIGHQKKTAIFRFPTPDY